MQRTLGTLWLLALGGLAAAGPAPGQDPVDPLDVLHEADRAIKQIFAVRLWSQSVPSGLATRFAAPAAGETVMIGWTGAVPQRFHVHVTTEPAGGETPRELTGGGDGDSFFLIDHATQKGYEDMDPGVLGSHRNTLLSAGMLEFVHDRPFDDEIGADALTLRGISTIAGVACYEIHVVYSGGRGESTWYFATSDYLPRRRVRIFNTPEGTGAIETTIVRLEVDPTVDPGLFRMKLPQGYEQIDDFAP